MDGPQPRSTDATAWERALASLQPTARTLARRTLGRVIRRDRRIGGFGREAPHAHAYAIERESLLELVSHAELHASDTLGDIVLLVQAPTEEELEASGPDAILARLWRDLYAARVLAAFDEVGSERNMPASAIRARLHRLGQVEADEARATLRKERRLLPARPGQGRDTTTWSCFASTWAVLRAFSPAVVGYYFPALARREEEVDRLLSEDHDLKALLEAARPDGAPDLAVAREILAEAETEPQAPRALPATSATSAARWLSQSDRPRRKGNLVRAALLAAAAARSVDGAAAARAREQLGADLEALGQRLEEVLGRNSLADPGRWRDALLSVALAAPHRFSAEGRLLYDLQRACVDHERMARRVDLVEWALSLGRRPIRRSLPSLQVVRVVRHLRRALHRLGVVRLEGSQTEVLRTLLEDAANVREERARDHLRPIVRAGIDRATRGSTRRVERVAAGRAVEELLDRVVEKGKINFPVVRDAVARSQAKLEDLRSPLELIRDPLLQLDRDLAAPLEGVYRRAELYRRWLQRLSALAFGTLVGRWLTKLVLLPAVGAVLVLEGLGHTVGLLLEKLVHVHLHWLAWPALGGVGAAILLLVNFSSVRRATMSALRAVGRGFRAVFVAFPRWIGSRPWVLRLTASRPWRLVVQWVFKPALWGGVPFGLSFFASMPQEARIGLGVGLYAAIAFCLATPVGRRFEEVASDGVVRSRRWLANRFFPSLIRWVLAVFRALLEGVERVLYSVDEWLRFRPGDRASSVALKAIVGLPWSALSYTLRLYVNLLLEPKYNPVKHFPVVTVAHKIILPMSFTLTDALSKPLAFMGATAGKWIAATTVFLLPGFFGFLAWELKENWKIYRRNRPRDLTPVVIGSHGETMTRLLRPGFHSGTVPKLFARLRRGLRYRRGRLRSHALRRAREGLHHAEEEVRRFVERELLFLLRQPYEVDDVALGSNRIRVTVRAGSDSIIFSFEMQSGFLLAERCGLLPAGDSELGDGIAGLYRLAGVQIDRADIERLLPTGAAYDVADEGLVVWPGPGYEREVVYPLDHRNVFRARESNGVGEQEPLPAIDRSALFLAPIAWTEWVTRWRDPPAAG